MYRWAQARKVRTEAMRRAVNGLFGDVKSDTFKGNALGRHAGQVEQPERLLILWR
jgi:hypothetical protein